MKRRLIVFLCLVFVFNSFFEVKEARAAIPFLIPAAAAVIGGVGIISKIFGLKDTVVKGLSTFIAFIIKWITFVFFYLLWVINNSILAPIIDFISQINPFAENGPILIIWNIFKNFAYILLVFFALLAGFQWLFGEDATAKRLIFNIIFVALLINFTFTLIKETFFLVDSLEKGLTGGASKKVGTIIAASLWQKDPFEEIQKSFNTIVNKKANEKTDEVEATVSNNLAMAFTYIFLVIFQMLIFIILVIISVIFILRYILLVFYTGVSPLALATIAIPESKGVFANLTKGLRIFEKWINDLSKWLLVSPIITILVIIGNIIQNNTFSQLRGLEGFGGLIEFCFILIFMVAWYVITIRVAIKLSGKAGETAKFAAMGILGATGMLASRAIMTGVSGKVGGVLQSTGEWVQEKVGIGGPLGWRTWTSQKIGKRISDIGEKLIEKRYEMEAKGVRTRLSTLEERLRKETDPQKIQAATLEITNMINRYKNVPYVLKTLSDDIGRMNINAFEKLVKDQSILPILAGPDSPKEVKDKFIDQLDRLPKRVIRDISKNVNLLQAYNNLSVDVFNKFVEKFSKELTDENAIEILSDDNLRNYFQSLPSDHSFRKTLNILSKNLLEAAISKSFKDVSRALTNFSYDTWRRTEEIDKVLKSFNLDTSKVLFETITMSEKPEIIINNLIAKSKGDPLRVAISKLSDQEIENLNKILSPQMRTKLESIILEERAAESVSS